MKIGEVGKVRENFRVGRSGKIRVRGKRVETRGEVRQNVGMGIVGGIMGEEVRGNEG